MTIEYPEFSSAACLCDTVVHGQADGANPPESAARDRNQSQKSIALSRNPVKACIRTHWTALSVGPLRVPREAIPISPHFVYSIGSVGSWLLRDAPAIAASTFVQPLLIKKLDSVLLLAPVSR